MKTTLIIPKKCKVGFQQRNDTYSGKLGYIIMNDGKVWRKEASWEGWRTKYLSDEDFLNEKKKSFIERQDSYTETYYRYLKYNQEIINGEPQWVLSSKESAKEWIEQYPTVESYLEDYRLSSLETYSYPRYNTSNDVSLQHIEFDNEPIEGFVLNKKAGGYSTGWNHRQTYCRVYDPRGWEFEISIPNLLYILENTNSIKGKGLEGKFIYSWDKKDLVLLPVDSVDYKEIEEYNSILSLKISKKDLVLGGIYLCSDNVKRTYLGEGLYYGYYGEVNDNKYLWFVDDNNSFNVKEVKHLKKFIELNPDYANLVDKLQEHKHYKKPEYVKWTKDNVLVYRNVREHYYPYRKYYYGYFDALFKIENTMIRKCVKFSEDGSESVYIVDNSKKEKETYKNIDELLNNHDLWQVSKTK